jgi:hypothetical protein
VTVPPDLGPDDLDEHGAPRDEPGLSFTTIRHLGAQYRDRADEQRKRTGEVNQGELDAWLRRTLRSMVFPEHVEVEFERVMQVVFEGP